MPKSKDLLSKRDDEWEGTGSKCGARRSNTSDKAPAAMKEMPSKSAEFYNVNLVSLLNAVENFDDKYQ